MLVGITGLAGAGKDTVGSYLVSNYEFTRYAFADKVKELTLQANPHIEEVNLYLDELLNETSLEDAKIEYYSLRKFLQGIGHGARQVFGDNFWIDQVFDQNLPWRTVITDVRYKNEFDAVRRNGGFIIRINRDVQLVNNHITETGHLDFEVDYTLDNNKGRPDLYRQINDLMLREFDIK